MTIKKGMGVRHLQALLLWFCLLSNNIHQGNAGIATVIMTEEVGGQVLFEVEDWIKTQIFGAFYYAFPLSAMMSGYLGIMINNKYCLLFNGLYSTTASYLTPYLIRTYGWKSYFSLRISQGFVQGFVMPQVYGQLTRWIPPEEFVYLGPMTLSGMFAGTFFINCLGGFLGVSEGDWDSIFIFSGHCSLLWCFAFAGLGAQEPETCWYISNDERSYILMSLIHRARITFQRFVPLRAIAKSLPSYAIIVSYAAHNWGFQTINKMIPLIFYNDFSLSLPNTGLVTGGPFLLLVIVTFPCSYFGYFLLHKKMISLGTLRFIANSIGQYGMGLSLLFMSFSETLAVTVVFYCTALTLSSCQLMGVYMNHFDLAPNFAGFLFGWTTGLAHIFSSLGPYFSSLIYNKHEKGVGWTAVLFACASSNLIGNLFFVMFGSANIQPFNTIHDEND